HCTPSFRTHFGRPDLPPRLVLTIPRRRLAAPRPAGAGQELRSSYLEGKAAEAPAKIGARARSMARRRQGSARARNRGEECARHFARAREGVRGALRSPGLTVHGEDRSPAGKLHRAVAAVCRSAARLAAEEENQHEEHKGEEERTTIPAATLREAEFKKKKNKKKSQRSRKRLYWLEGTLMRQVHGWPTSDTHDTCSQASARDYRKTKTHAQRILRDLCSCLPSRKHTKTSGRNRAEICFRCASPPREPATSVEEKSSNVGPNSDVKRLPRS
ncbi:unnamed protein product, partial [Prorocentrum cordatum]